MKPLLCFLFWMTGGALSLSGHSFFGPVTHRTPSFVTPALYRAHAPYSAPAPNSTPAPNLAPAPHIVRTIKPLFDRLSGFVADSITWKHLRVRFETGATPQWQLILVKPDQSTHTIARMTGDALTEVVAFSPEQPVLTSARSWNLTKPNATTLVMSTDLNGRTFERRVQIDTTTATIHVTTTLHWLGNEVVSSVVDNWDFFTPQIDFAWVPNLRPEPQLVIGEHTFRSPAIVLEHDQTWMAITPDLNRWSDLPRARLAALDLNRREHPLPRLGFGLKGHDPTFHVYYRHDPARVFTYPAGPVRYAYHLHLGYGNTRSEYLGKVNDFLWQRYASPHLNSSKPQMLPFADYAQRSYNTLDSLQQFVSIPYKGTQMGAYKAENHGNYFMLPRQLIWNQAWFNAQRSAYGLDYFGRLLGEPRWVSQAKQTAHFTLAAPSYEGLFPAIFAFEQDQWIGSPLRLNGGVNRIHSSSAAWTGLWLWRAHQKHPQEAYRDRVFALADFLVARQEASGSIPAWFDYDPGSGTLSPHPTLQHAAETAGSALLLGELALDTRHERYLRALLKAADFLLREVLPEMKFYDFETFWSCSWKSPDMQDPYTGVNPQNNYSMYWTAETFRYAYQVSGEARYLEAMLETMQLLNLYQQVWNPPFLKLYAIGGFGVMNTDGEWNDARQAVFAPLYMQVYTLTGNPIWMQRGIAALRASFALMAAPEHCEISPHTCKAYPLGLMPESLAHGGSDGTSGRSDTGWGEAGALASAAYVMEQFGQVYVDVSRAHAFGIDGVTVVDFQRVDQTLKLSIREDTGTARILQIKRSDGKKHAVEVLPGKISQVDIPIK